ncbi:MAG: tRNA pseudouridine synthase B [Nitrospirales bacterium]|nr:MAG: tRNA pseudouridine synthase B [Nitrospirales bacterium]
MESILTAAHPQRSSNIVPSHLHGILNVLKPVGWTSHDVVLHLRRLLGIQKIGHAGTLDPAATGVLPVLLGKGTKIASYLLEWEKEYVAVLRLGQSTDTQDATGTIIQQMPVDGMSESMIRSAVNEFVGDIQQIPPMYSAVKIKGQPLYRAARRGETVERNPRPVTIYRLETLAVRGCDVDLRVHCSKGTYIRTLCADIGDRLKVGGHLLWLERSRVGPFSVQDALEVEGLTDARFSSEMSRSFLTIDKALPQFPVVIVKDEDRKKVMNGVPIPWSDISVSDDEGMSQICEGQRVRIRDTQGQLLAIGVTGLSARSSGGHEMGTIRVETMCVER